MLGQAFDGGFRGVVSWISWWVGDPLLRAGDDHARRVGGSGMRGDEREQGVEPVNHTEEVDIHDLVEVVCVFPAASKTYSCIESKKGNFTYRFNSLADPRTLDILLGGKYLQNPFQLWPSTSRSLRSC